ncbi:hypothetical protein ACFP2T_36075 [Plantactinospora solaniradicis]|uniref:Uncharacterized protein n=1 Tax=Plantactinospora solaniradicis TaxID=1723736 RepID=A0ABW1KJD6_9ACTN
MGAVLLLSGCAGEPPGAVDQPIGSTPSVVPGASATSGPTSYAACMRSYGVTNFPEPDASGGYRIPDELGIDPGSPQYQAAYEACQGLA